MIYLENILQIDPSQYDEVWLITHSLTDQTEEILKQEHVFHVPELAPSDQLFAWYRQQVHTGDWGERLFQIHYVPTFLQEIHDYPTARKKLEELVDLSYKIDVAVTCYCENESICHRSIISGILWNMGADISSAYRRYSLE